MKQPENVDFVKELAFIILDALRKQAFPVVLLLCAVCALTYALLEVKKDGASSLEAVRIECRATVSTLQADLKICNEAREVLHVQVAKLEERVRYLENGIRKR